VTKDPVKVCPLSREVMLPYGRRNLYPSHYKTAFAFSTILYPQFHQLALRLAFPFGTEGENYGLTTFHLCTRVG
jgi:hypothetical protein